MSDPLSIAASISGLITLADIVFLRVAKYVKSVKNAEKEIIDLGKEVNLVAGTVNMLERVATVLEAKNEPPIEGFRMHHVEACSVILREISKMTEKYEDRPGGKLKRLIWPYTSSKTKEMLADLSRHKESLNLAVSATSLEALLRCLTKEEDRERTTASILADVQKTREIAVRIHEDTSRQRILSFFLRYNPQSNYEMSKNLRHPRTGMWLERHLYFQQWLSNHGTSLWLSGIPGAGKTVLAGLIISHALARSSNSVAVCFFFCDYKNEATQSPVNILGGLAYQLARQSETAYSMLEEYYFELHPDTGLPRPASTKDLERIIITMSQVFERTYLVVDGLDECGDHAEDIVKVLCDMTENSGGLSVAVLSRDEDDIQRHLRDPENNFLNIEIAAHTEDITEFLASEIERRIRDKKLEFEDLSLKAEILETLVAGAHGMFRWVACQLDHLGYCMSDEQCREALRSLPPDLPETYMRILRRVPKAKQHFVQMTLHFVAYANPRLDTAQLREVLSIPSTSQHLSPSRIIREDAIARYCSALIRKSNDGNYFEFAHFSVQEFLTSSILQSSDLGMFYITKSQCNKLLALRCLEYLQLDNFNHLPTATSEELAYMKQRDDEFRLYNYAARYWLCFAREEWTHPELLAEAKRLFDPQKTTHFTSWAVVLVCDIWSFHHIQESFDMLEIGLIEEIIHDSFRPLHLAATMSLPEISSFLLRTSDHHETECMFGIPIKCAVNCLYGALQHFKAQPYSFSDISPWFQRYTGTDSLELSYTIETVGLFLGMNLHAPEDLLSASLCDGISVRNLSVAQLLVDKGLTPTQSDLDYFKRTMSQTVADRVICWDEKHLSSLCKFCEALSSRIDASPLHLEFCQSVWGFCLQLTPALSDLKGYNISSKVTDDAHSLETLALEVIRWNFDIDVLQMIVDDQRVDVSSILSPVQEDGLLHLLVRAGHDQRRIENLGWIIQAENMLDLLLSAGCSLSKRNSDGHTPLTLAIKEGLIRLAIIILKRCKNAPTAWECQTPILLLVAESGSEEILDLFQSMGLEVNPADYELKSPLHCLARNAGLALVKKLETMIPDARQCRSNAKLPWEFYVDTILAKNSEFDSEDLPNSPAAEVLEYLVQPLVNHPNSFEASKVWEHFTSRTLQSEDLTLGYINEVSRCLVCGGIFDSYERDRSSSALLPIAEVCSTKWLVDRNSVEDFPLTEDTLCFLLKTTAYWNNFQESFCAVDLLKVSIILDYSTAVDQLLTRGISVHRRCQGISALEYILASPATHESDTLRVRKLLDHADPICLNHTNPTSGLGLIHLSNKADVPQFRNEIVEMLLGCGVGPDLRVSFWPYSSALVYHLCNRRSDLAATLLLHGADPTVPCRSGCTAAHAAAMRGSVSFLSCLLEHSNLSWKIDWESQSVQWHDGQIYKGIRPLHCAALSSVDCLQTVLEKVTNITLEAPAENGYTAVHFAVEGGNTRSIEILHARGANINARSVDGRLALHIAVAKGNFAAIQRLLELGSEMTSDCDGATPLLLAYQHNNPEIIDRLRGHNGGQRAVVSTSMRSTALAKAVFRAIQAASLSSCQELLTSQSTVDIDIDLHEGLTALGVAVRFRRLEIITWLLQQGANANYPCGNDESIIQSMMRQPRLNSGLQAMLKRYTATGGSVLNEPGCLVATAVRANNQEGLRILLDHLKANVKLYAEEAGAGSPAALALAVNRKWQGRTPLHWAASMKNVSTVQLLIDSGANLEATDYKGWTPLLVSIKAPAIFDLSAVVRALLESGSDLKYRDNNGITPIAEACTQGNPRIISALIDRGADVLVEDYGKRNVLHRLFTCDETGETSVARPALFIKLTRMGVNPHKLDMFGCSALHLSIFHKSMVALLLNGDLQIQEERPIPWSTVFLGRNATNEAAACLTTAFRLYRRKLSTEKLRTLLNLEAGGFWNPMSFAASRGQIQVMKNILSLGIPIDFEGCPEGSALMAASSAGNLESVIYLVRHGASISFQGHNDFRSAVKLAATSPRVLRWMLVDRFTDQKKLDQFRHKSTSPSTHYKPWSGIQKAEMVISGQWERQPHESCRRYWTRLTSMIEEFRGKFLPPNNGKTTRRQSKLVPTESVKIAVGGYFVPYDASVGERVTRKSKWSELSLEVRECLERYCL